MSALIEYVDPNFSARLTDDQKNLIVEELYAGLTLLAICEKHELKRYEIDLEARADEAFGVAIKNAKSALGDIQAERVEMMLLGLMRDLEQPLEVTVNTEGDDSKSEKAAIRVVVDDVKLRLSVAKELSAHYRWSADRSSTDYKRKQAEKPSDSRKRRIATNVPKAEPVADPKVH